MGSSVDAQPRREATACFATQEAARRRLFQVSATGCTCRAIILVPLTDWPSRQRPGHDPKLTHLQAGSR